MITDQQSATLNHELVFLRMDYPVTVPDAVSRQPNHSVARQAARARFLILPKQVFKQRHENQGVLDWPRCHHRAFPVRRRVLRSIHAPVHYSLRSACEHSRSNVLHHGCGFLDNHLLRNLLSNHFAHYQRPHLEHPPRMTRTVQHTFQ